MTSLSPVADELFASPTADSSSPRPSQGRKRLGMLKFSALVFLMVCAGPFGVEATVRAAGPLIALLGIAVIPLLYCLPQALVCAEMSSMMPSNLGYILWVYRALGDFCGFLNAIFQILNVGTDLPVYPVLVSQYLSKLLCLLTQTDGAEAQRQCTTLDETGLFWVKMAMCIVACVLNVLRIEILGHTGLWLSVALMLPFVAGFAMAVPRVDPLQQWTFGVVGSGSQPMAQSLHSVDWCLFFCSLIWLFTGWDTMGCLAGEARFPPHQFILSFVIAVMAIWLAYTLAVVAALTVPNAHESSNAWRTGYLTTAFDAIWHPYLGVAVTAASVLSCFSEYTVEMSAQSRALWAMAQPNIIILEDGSLHLFKKGRRKVAMRPRLTALDLVKLNNNNEHTTADTPSIKRRIAISDRRKAASLSPAIAGGFGLGIVTELTPLLGANAKINDSIECYCDSSDLSSSPLFPPNAGARLKIADVLSDEKELAKTQKEKKKKKKNVEPGTGAFDLRDTRLALESAMHCTPVISARQIEMDSLAKDSKDATKAPAKTGAILATDDSVFVTLVESKELLDVPLILTERIDTVNVSAFATGQRVTTSSLEMSGELLMSPLKPLSDASTDRTTRNTTLRRHSHSSTKSKGTDADTFIPLAKPSISSPSKSPLFRTPLRTPLRKRVDDARDILFDFDTLPPPMELTQSEARTVHEEDVGTLVIDENRQLVHRSDRIIPVNIIPQWTRINTTSARTQQPVVAALLVTAVNMLLCNVQFSVLVEVSVFFNVFCWVFEYWAFLALRYKEPLATRPFEVPCGIRGAWFVALVKCLVVGPVFAITVFQKPEIALIATTTLFCACVWYWFRRSSPI